MQPKNSTQARSRLPRWAWGVGIAVVCVLLAERALHALRGHARLWGELRNFVLAFGGILGVVLLLAAGLALLFVIDALLFREDSSRGGTDVG